MEVPLLELIARGSILYFAILVLMRIMPRRAGGELAMMDLIYVVLIAQAAAHSLGDYTSILDGVVLIATLMGWNYLLNYLSFRIPVFEWLVSPPPVQVVRDGRLLRRNIRREFITHEEIIEQLREKGIDDLKGVRAAYIESDGRISVIRRK